MNFWNTFYNLCINVGKSPNAVASELNISSGTITWWKKGKVPHPSTAQKIANYFNVSVGYLLGYEQSAVVENASEEKEKTPDENNLTEGEQMLLALFRQVPEDKQPHLIQLIKVALGMQ